MHVLGLELGAGWGSHGSAEIMKGKKNQLFYVQRSLRNIVLSLIICRL